MELNKNFRFFLESWSKLWIEGIVMYMYSLDSVLVNIIILYVHVNGINASTYWIKEHTNLIGVPLD